MKEKFIKSSIILIIGGIITKILGMIIKLITTRLLGDDIGIYMLVIPTFSLFINLASFGFPVAISKMVSEGNKKSIKILSSSTIASLFINIILILSIIIISPYLSHNLLKNDKTYYAILAISLVIPFTSISSIIRSYFFGKEKTLPHVISNIIEDIVRIIIIYKGLPLFINKGAAYSIFFLIASNVITELVSIIVLLLFLPKNIKISSKDIKPSKIYLKETLEISIPTTINRLIASITYFLEPIILTSVLLHTGFNNHYITLEYGILSGYVLPTLLLPSFFSMAISQALLPIVSKNYFLKKYEYTKKKIIEATLLCLSVGFIFTIIFILFPKELLYFLYHTNKGINYMKFLSPIILLQYVISPLSTSLDAMGKSKDNLKIIIITSLIRTLLLPLFALFKIGIYSLIYAIIINIIVGLLLNIKYLKKYL